jgi:myo-inositol-1(or 4)-monophosphatase
MTPSAEDWLSACRRSTAGLRAMLAAKPTTAERAVEEGRGQGGDNSLVIDLGAEDVIFAELDALHAGGARFTAISEERGEVDYGDPATRVIIDPIDGSLNAKRTLPPHSFSFAVARGTTMADVDFGFVYDFGTNEEWAAARNQGATLNARPIEPLDERRGGDGRLELLGIESADPRWVAQFADDLAPFAYRLRALGSIAITLCQVAATRLDAMVSLKRARAVDAAAGQLIVREAGGVYAPLDMELDLKPRAPIMAARNEATIEALQALLTPNAQRPTP